MEQESNRFTIYLQNLSGLIEVAEREENPAIYLFKNNARGTLFMLEALARIYTDVLDPHLFSKLKNKFKDFEDGLGKIDYYNSMEDTFKNNKKISKKYLQYFKEQSDQKIKGLNNLLVEEDWVSKHNKRIVKTTNELAKVDWKDGAGEAKAISSYYKSEVIKIDKFINKTKFHFTDIENDVHELRRKIRWLSIYPQALQGVFQFDDKIITESHLSKYLTKEIINSPFNQLPKSDSKTNVILLNKNYFLALSWMIAELGKLKDEGLILTGLAEAIMGSDAINHAEAISKAQRELGLSQRKMPEILKQAESISKVFFSENNLEHLLA